MASDAPSKKKPRVIDLEDYNLDEDGSQSPKRPMGPDDDDSMDGQALVPATQQSTGSLAQLGPVFDEILSHVPDDLFPRVFNRLFLTLSKTVMWHLAQVTRYVIVQHKADCDAKCNCNLIPSIMTRVEKRRKKKARLRELVIKMHASTGHQTKQSVLKQPDGLVKLEMRLNKGFTRYNERSVGLSQTAIAAIPSAPTLTSLSLTVKRTSGDLPLDFSKFACLKTLKLFLAETKQALDMFLDIKWPPGLTSFTAPDMSFGESNMGEAPVLLVSLTCLSFNGTAGWESNFPHLKTLSLTSTEWIKHLTTATVNGAGTCKLPSHIEVLSIPFPIGGSALGVIAGVLPRSLKLIQQCGSGSVGWCDLNDMRTTLDAPNLRAICRAIFRVSGDAITAFSYLAFTSIRVLSIGDTLIIDGAFNVGLRQLRCLKSLIIYKAIAGIHHGRPTRADHNVMTLPCTPTIETIRIVYDASCLPDSRKPGMFGPIDQHRLGPTYQPQTLVLPTDPADMTSLKMIGVYGPPAIIFVGYNGSVDRTLRGEVVFESESLGYGLPTVMQLTVLTVTHMQSYMSATPGVNDKTVGRKRHAVAFSISPGGLYDRGARLSLSSAKLASLKDDYSSQSGLSSWSQ
jgi:hypothetical protein